MRYNVRRVSRCLGQDMKFYPQRIIVNDRAANTFDSIARCGEALLPKGRALFRLPHGKRLRDRFTEYS